MCGKFEADLLLEQVKRRFKLLIAPPMAKAAEMRPTDRVLTIDALSGQPRGRLLGWGLQVDWDKKPLINARAESLSEKTTFRPLLATRCLIPATAYFEWGVSDGGAKQKMRIRPHGLDEDQPFAMAGLIGADNDTVTILTCAPAPDIATIHDRMPVILQPDDEPAWIDPDVSFADLGDKLIPYPARLDAENVDNNPALL